VGGATKNSWIAAVVVGGVVAVGVGVGWVLLSGGDEEGSRRDGDEREAAPVAQGEKRARPRRPGQAKTADGLLPAAEKRAFEGLPNRPASGPLRFVARFGEGRPFRPEIDSRSESEARALAASVRSKVLAGEDPVTLIRGLSDPPSGLSAEIVGRHESLRPGEASEVVEITNGYAVFFGGVPRPPE
jgi:hypothetical protein